jgi:hypothetical protein
LQAWFLLSGVAGTFFFPFLPVFLTSAGLTGSQLGVVFALRPWLAAPIGLAVTAIADRMRLHRTLLVLTVVLSTVLRASLPVVSDTLALAALFLVAESVGAPVGVMADSTILSNCRKVGPPAAQQLPALRQAPAAFQHCPGSRTTALAPGTMCHASRTSAMTPPLPRAAGGRLRQAAAVGLGGRGGQQPGSRGDQLAGRGRGIRGLWPAQPAAVLGGGAAEVQL